MTFKILLTFLLIALVGCKPKSDFFEMPVPANLEYGQVQTNPDADWLALKTFDFGRKPFASTSKSTIYVKNTGTLPASVKRIWIEAEHSEYFQIENRCLQAVASQLVCPIHITYSPNIVGNTPATVYVSYLDGAGEVAQKSLPITASASNLAFLKFENEKMNIKSNTIGYTLSSYFKVLYNGSSLTANGFTIEPAKGVIVSDPIDGSFSIDRANSTCGDVIQADCVIKVDFSPAVVGTSAGTFNVNYFNGAEVLKLTAEASGTGLQATVLAELSATTADFGNVVVNPLTPAGLSIPIKFAGSVPADNIVIKGPSNSVFVIDSNKSKTTCGTQIAGTCALYVNFDPTVLGAQTSTITIEYTSNGQTRSPLKLTINGKGVQPALLASDLQALSHGAAPAYKTISKKFTLTNSGEVALSQLSAITLSDSVNFSSAVDAACGTLAAKAICGLTINYRPKSAGVHTTDVSFSYFNGREVKSLKLSASGSGTAPLVLEGSRTIDFGNVMIGNATLPNAINSAISIYGLTTLTNANQFVMNPAALSSPFAFTSTVCRPPFDPKKANSCSFGVVLTKNSGMPADVAVTQNFTATYTADANEGSGVLNFIAKMTPRAAPVISFSAAPAFKTVSVKDSSTISITLKNNSAYFATAYRSIAIEGSDNFVVSSNSCTGGLAANGSCAISVAFTPKDAGTFTAKLKYVYSDQIKDQVAYADLSAIGSSDVTLVASATVVDFGSVFVGDAVASRTIDLKYSGLSNWTNNITVSAPFKITPVNCGSAVNCQLKIDYAPVSSGTLSSSASLSYAPALTAPGVINLTLKGTATMRAPVLSVSPAVLAKTLVGNQLTQTITIKNAGNSIAEGLTLPDLQGVLVYAREGQPGSSGNCAVGQNLLAGESCTVKVVYTPVKIGKQDISLIIGYGLGSVKSSVTAKLSVTGTQMIQVFAGGFQTCILNELGQVICWGRNTSGQLGQGTKTALNKKPAETPIVKFESDITVSQLAVGDSHTCAIVSSSQTAGQVVCWGSNDNGRLGIGDLTTQLLQPTNSKVLSAVNLGLDENGDKEEAISIAAGFEHTCALTKTGKVKCWGGNTSGQLGIDTKTSVGLTKLQMSGMKAVSLGRKAVSISAGAGHSCAVLEDGTSKCWGDNFYGQLGAGSDVEKIGAQINPSVASLSEIKLGASFTVKEILASSGAFTCALSTSGDVKCFGKTVADESSQNPFYGVLGVCWSRAAQNSSAVACASNTQLVPTTSIGYLATDMGDRLSKVSLGNLSVDQISLGSSFTCILSSDHQVKCFGTNDQGQLGIGSRIASTQASQAALSASDGGAVQIATGYEHACAVMANNTLRCWGSNFQNATGLSSLGVAGNSGVSAATLPNKLPLIYDGR